ncbi:MAG TPA: hypothetical protein VKP04_04325, partial [Ktedonobacteraceae bacterium]|nr:hypothetical protein [Ktedonobacteraceae bacterium]
IGGVCSNEISIEHFDPGKVLRNFIHYVVPYNPSPFMLYFPRKNTHTEGSLATTTARTTYHMNKTIPQSQPALLTKQLMRKVPEVTVYFWIIKLLSTAMGESTSDYLVFHIDRYVAVVLGGVGLVVALVLQLAVRRYIPWIYWLAVVMVAISGTMVADVIHIVLGVPYLISTIFFTVLLAVIFIVWYATEKTLSIHSINTLRRELFYWATVMATFALGTAVGDLTAATFGLGYFTSGVLFAILFAIPALAYWLFRINAIFAFWFAYIMTRPFGASFADWFGKPIFGGLGLGDEPVVIVLTFFIIVLVGYVSITHVDIKSEQR